jgi:hypothetical protein
VYERSIMHHTWALLAVTLLNFVAMFGTFGFVQTTPNLVTDFGYPESSANDAFLVIQCYLTVYGARGHPVRLNVVCPSGMNPDIEGSCRLLHRYCHASGIHFDERVHPTARVFC